MLNVECASVSIQHSTFNIQHSSFPVSAFQCPASVSIQHSTFNIQHSSFPVSAFQCPSAFATILGFFAATRSSACAGPSGECFPSSHACNVARLTPIMSANSDCDWPSL